MMWLHILLLRLHCVTSKTLQVGVHQLDARWCHIHDRKASCAGDFHLGRGEFSTLLRGCGQGHRCWCWVDTVETNVVQLIHAVSPQLMLILSYVVGQPGAEPAEKQGIAKGGMFGIAVTVSHHRA